MDEAVTEMRHGLHEAAGTEVARGPGQAEWRPKTIGLRYSLSYVKLLEARFRALEDTRPFDPYRPRIHEPEPPFQKIPSGHDVVVVRHELLHDKIAVIQKLRTCCVTFPVSCRITTPISAAAQSRHLGRYLRKPAPRQNARSVTSKSSAAASFAGAYTELLRKCGRIAHCR